jgi:AcrR family transcriptional regulator
MAILVQPSDGRRRRSQASRRAIVEAMLALVRAGDVAPSAEDVAARGRVGLRTVFRHFENMETLYREMNEVMLVEIMPLAARPFAAITWRGRLDELIARRAEIFERILPVKIAADIARHKSRFLERETRKLIRAQRESLTALLPRAIRENATLLEGLDLILSFDSWRRLRLDQELAPRRAHAAIVQLVARLVD